MISKLRILSLPFNDSSGTIPVKIRGTEKLEMIDLEGSLIHGNLQSHFNGLRRVLVKYFNGLGEKFMKEKESIRVI